MSVEESGDYGGENRGEPEPGGISRYIASVMQAYTSILVRPDAPVPRRLHALRMLRPMLFEALRNPKYAEWSEIAGKITGYLRSIGVRVEEPPTPPPRAGRGEGDQSPLAVWFMRVLERRPGEDVFTWLDRAGEMAGIIAAHLRFKMGKAAYKPLVAPGV